MIVALERAMGDTAIKAHSSSPGLKSRRETRGGAGASRVGLRLLASFCVLAILGSVGSGAADLQRYVESAQAWTARLGAAAPVGYGALYVVSTLLGVPGTPLAILAGLLFGSMGGILVLAVASGISATLGFLIARHVARDAIAERFGDNESFRRVSRLVERRPWLIVLIRTVPVLPIALVNYGLGLTGIPFWRYALWSEVAMVLGDAMVVLGAQAFYDAFVAVPPSGALVSAMTAAGLLMLGLVGLGTRAFMVGLLRR